MVKGSLCGYSTVDPQYDITIIVERGLNKVCTIVYNKPFYTPSSDMLLSSWLLGRKSSAKNIRLMPQ